MKHVELWKAKLKAAKAERRIVVKVHNQTERALQRLSLEIEDLEKKIERKLAKPTQ
jgi:hypothetical protein